MGVWFFNGIMEYECAYVYKCFLTEIINIDALFLKIEINTTIMGIFRIAWYPQWNYKSSWENETLWFECVDDNDNVITF